MHFMDTCIAVYVDCLLDNNCDPNGKHLDANKCVTYREECINDGYD